MRPLATKAKPDPPPAPSANASLDPSPEFAEARKRWQAARSKMRALDARREQLQVGLSYARLSTSQPEHMRWLVSEFDQDVLAAIKRSPRKAALEAEELTDQIIELQPIYTAEHEAFEAARSAEAARIARLFVDRHRKAVLALAAALEELNQAIEMERAVRRDYAKASPEAASAMLSDLSSDFADLDLLEWHSTGATWARHIRALGFAK